MQHSVFLNENENVKKILKYIQYAGVSVGERLPSEREMAAELGVSRNSLREALKILQTLGVLEIRRGSGIFLQKADVYPNREGALWLFTHRGEILNMLTVREALDLRAIELIPENEYNEVRQELKICIRQAQERAMNNDELLKNDLEFHNIIRKAADNDILLNICVALTGNIYDERDVLFSDQMRIVRSMEEHKHIANAFGSGDVNEVKQAYTAHLVSIRRSIEDAMIK